MPQLWFSMHYCMYAITFFGLRTDIHQILDGFWYIFQIHSFSGMCSELLNMHPNVTRQVG